MKYFKNNQMNHLKYKFFQSILFYIVVVLVCIVSACNREDTETKLPVITTNDEQLNYYDSHYIGRVQNENDEALSNVLVSVNDAQVLTNIYGTYLLRYAKTNANGSLIRFAKKGFYEKYIYMINPEGNISNATISLSKKKEYSVFENSEEQIFTIANDIIITIPSNSFLNNLNEVHKGKVKLYLHDNDILKGNLPFVRTDLKIGLIASATTFQLTAEDENGTELQLGKSIVIKTTSKKNLGYLDIKKERWVQVKSNNVDKLGTFICGDLDDIFRVSTTITNNENIPFSQCNVNIRTNTDDIALHVLQNGKVDFYVPAKAYTFTVKDKCDIVLFDKQFDKPTNTNTSIDRIIISNEKLLNLKSEFNSCEGPVSDGDRINISFGKNNTSIYYQTTSMEQILVSKCEVIEKVNYFRGTELLYTLHPDLNTISDNSLLLSSKIQCINRVSGYLAVNNVPMAFDKNQFKIFREKNEIDNLTITDFSGFLISIPKVTQIGKYNADLMLFNNPLIADCENEQCKNTTVEIKKISTVGKIVNVVIKGFINGVSIYGEFNSELSN